MPYGERYHIWDVARTEQVISKRVPSMQTLTSLIQNEHLNPNFSQHTEWRRGYYNQERTWEAGPPKPGDVNEIVRRHTSQKLFCCSRVL